jgi:hypothetical protein
VVKEVTVHRLSVDGIKLSTNTYGHATAMYWLTPYGVTLSVQLALILSE